MVKFLPEILIIYLKISLQRIPYIYKNMQNFVTIYQSMIST